MTYKNMSQKTKTFYGIQFEPGEEHNVPGPIHDPGFIVVKNPVKGVKTRSNTSVSVTSPTKPKNNRGRKKYV